MNYSLTLLLIAVNCISLAQFSDDFEDGDFTTNPSWVGETSNFEVNASNELHLLAPAVTDTSYLSVPSTLIDNCTWDIRVRMDFNPSSSNYTRVYLVSDNSDLEASLNGYFVQIGGTTDEISLYEQTGTTTTEILDGLDGSVDMTEVDVRIRVTRDAAGNFELLRDTLGGQNFFSEGQVLDITHTSTSFFGVFCKYTATRSELFYFDDCGAPYVDGIAPTLNSTTVISSTALDLEFSESMDQISVETITNYLVDNGIGNPITANIDGSDPRLVHLTFGTAFTNGQDYEITVSNVEDLAGNPITTSTDNFTFIVPGIPQYNDVIITEFFADPTPQVGLPATEYVEIYNRSNSYFDLENWEIGDESGTTAMTSYILGPGEYVLICNIGEGGQFFISNFVELSLPSLNNSADAVVLKDDLGNTLDSIYFDLNWYNDGDKEEGGWSCERKNLESPCNGSTNWAASVDPLGGTPGIQNSVWTNSPDVTAPELESFVIIDASTVVLYFNEIMDTSSTFTTVQMNPALNFNTNWTGLTSLTLNFVSPMESSVIYQLEFEGVTDCWGNSTAGNLMLGLPDSVEAGDLILNEIMFDPLTGGSDYVEIVNISEKILDLSGMWMANWDDSIANFKSITSNQYLVFPNQYVVLTENIGSVESDFTVVYTETMIEMDLPTYPNDSGTVYLLSADYALIDYFHYDEDYHHSLIDDPDGKALERITLGGEMNNPNIWHTAAEYVEWGTPGYQNSQSENFNGQDQVTLNNQIFSPDNDGHDDVLLIELNLEGTDNVVDVEIFDNRGRPIRELKDNYFAGNQAVVVWDGITNEGEKAPIGTYLVLVSIVDAEGELTKVKLVCVVAGNI